MLLLVSAGTGSGAALPYQDPTPELLAVQRGQFKTANVIASSVVRAWPVTEAASKASWLKAARAALTFRLYSTSSVSRRGIDRRLHSPSAVRPTGTAAPAGSTGAAALAPVGRSGDRGKRVSETARRAQGQFGEAIATPGIPLRGGGSSRKAPVLHLPDNHDRAILKQANSDGDRAAGQPIAVLQDAE